ncbi:MAG TPA: radical SAM protein [Polyangiaceae bacterium]|nr:radical SAM protein [Polyangiaceae bacterium]
MSLRGHYLLNEMTARAGVPSGVHLQVADRCNHACRHCYQVQGRKGEMSTAEIKALLDELAEAGIFLLNVSGGEATLRPDLLEILRYARGKGFALRLFTNGYTMTEALARAIRQIGVLSVEVSVYSDEAAGHDAVTRVPGSHARTVEGVRHLIAAGVRVHLKAPATAVVPDAFARVRRLAAELGGGLSVITSSDITPMEDGDQASRELAAAPAELVARGAMRPWLPPDDLEAAMREARAEASCGACRDSVTVLANGDLRPCTDIVAPLGNVRKRRFLDMYREPGAQMVRALTWGDVHGCRDCHFLPGCERCHASASHQGGDLLGPYAAGCAAMLARYEAGAGALTLLEPDPACGPGRDRRLGPFRIVAPGVVQPAPDVVDEADEERRRAFPWVTPRREFLEAMSYGGAGEPPPKARRRLPLAGGTP